MALTRGSLRSLRYLYQLFCSLRATTFPSYRGTTFPSYRGTTFPSLFFFFYFFSFLVILYGCVSVCVCVREFCTCVCVVCVCVCVLLLLLLLFGGGGGVLKGVFCCLFLLCFVYGLSSAYYISVTTSVISDVRSCNYNPPPRLFGESDFC